MPYGRQSSRSKSTGPAAIGAAVARRIAVTASANSPGASGGSVAPDSSERSSSSTLRRSGSRPKSVGRSPFASGHSFASSPVRGGANADAVAELDRRTAGGDPDHRRDGSVLVTLAEERALELDVRAVERCIVPVEAAARLGRAHQERQQNAAEEGFVLVGAWSRMCAREDRRGGLTPELVDGELCIRTSSQACARAPR